jgi:hypothetical protein
MPGIVFFPSAPGVRNVIFACLRKGTLAIITKKINATEAEISTQCLVVDGIAVVESSNSSRAFRGVGEEQKWRMPCAHLDL